jgi:hypothetical protein
MALFNLYFAPLIFLSYTSYIILNKNKHLTRYELLGLFVFVLPFLIYCSVARLFSPWSWAFHHDTPDFRFNYSISGVLEVQIMNEIIFLVLICGLGIAGIYYIYNRYEDEDDIKKLAALFMGLLIVLSSASCHFLDHLKCFFL